MQAVDTHRNLRQRLGEWVESPGIQNAIIAVILLNAATLGLETSATAQNLIGNFLTRIEQVVLAIFVLELAIKIFAFGWRFFRSAWNVFDFVIVSISLIPASGPFAILRALRILRVLRLVTKMDRLRHIIESLLKAIPSIGWIIFLLGMVFYIFGVMGTQLFAEAFPENFGHLGRTLYSLFQIMTLESWSESIARPVMEDYPWAWIYFVSFILITAFVILNLFIGIIVSTMQERHYEEEASRNAESEARASTEREEILQLMRRIDHRLDQLEHPRNPDRSDE